MTSGGRSGQAPPGGRLGHRRQTARSPGRKDVRGSGADGRRARGGVGGLGQAALLSPPGRHWGPGGEAQGRDWACKGPTGQSEPARWGGAGKTAEERIGQIPRALPSRARTCGQQAPGCGRMASPTRLDTRREAAAPSGRAGSSNSPASTTREEPRCAGVRWR